MQDDPTTCRFIRSEEQHAVWAVKQCQELAEAATIVAPPKLMRMYGEGDADLRHEVNTLKQMVDSLVVEVWNMKMGKVCQCRK